MFGAAALLVMGCKQDPPPAPVPTTPTPPRVSPVPNKHFAGQAPVVFPDLAVASPDAGAEATKKAAPAPPPAPSTDAGAAAEAAAVERKKTERAFDKVLGGAKGALKGCLDAGVSGSGEAKLKIRLRSGTVVGSNVSGVPSGVGTCISNVLQSLRVRDPSGQSLTIERGIKYSEPKK